ncbi:MAG: response regulator [Alphaproteobacteria bacterium]|nr:response regulator [Alphaproteobacteria bacterium]
MVLQRWFGRPQRDEAQPPDATPQTEPPGAGASDGAGSHAERTEPVAEAGPPAAAVDPTDLLFDRAPVGIAVIGEGLRVVRRNAAFEATFGSCEHLIEPLIEEDREALRILFPEGTAGRREAAARADPPPLSPRDPVEVRLAGEPVRAVELFFGETIDVAADGPVRTVYAMDATKRINLETQMIQSQKMQAVGQLAGGVAHDFNNLLTAMIGYCDLLLLRHRPGDQSFADIMQVKQNASRAANLVRQLLAFSRQQTLRPRVLDISEVLSELAHLLRRVIGETIELRLDYGRDVGLIRCDQGQLEQVILNLAVNARDAMPLGGRVVISTRNFDLPKPQQIRGKAMPAGRYVLIEVDDTGTGIPEDIRERIFEPFFTTKAVGSGTGLGLATVYGIVEQTGGFLDLDSRVGVGTTFRIYLPVHEATTGGVQKSAQKEPAARDLTGAETILLVEDEDPVRVFSARALRNKGYEVIEARTAEAALDILEDEEVQIDLLVTDVVMPGMDGPTLVREIRQRRGDIKVICISGYSEDTIRERIEADEDLAFLSKPFSLKQLASAVKDVLAAD